jgi:hypothetical protein
MLTYCSHSTLVAQKGAGGHFEAFLVPAAYYVSVDYCM